MAKYIDSFGRETLIEVLPSFYNKRIGFIIRKERQSIAESWDINTAKLVAEELMNVIQMMERENAN